MGQPVPRMLFKKPEDNRRRLFVLRTRIKSIVKPREHPHAASLHPYVLARIVDGAGPIQAVVIAAVLAIERVPQPKRQHALVEFFAVFGEERFRHPLDLRLRTARLGPIQMVRLAARLVGPLIGVGAEEVTLGLQQIGR